MAGDASLGAAVLDLEADPKPLEQDLAKAEQMTKSRLGKLSKNISKMGGDSVRQLSGIGTTALKVIGGVAIGATAAIGAAAIKLAMDAAPLQGVMDAFKGVAESAGEAGDEMLDALKKGSAGMITNRDLMETFNKAAQLVGTEFAVQLPDAMGYLGKVAAATGQDMGFMLDSLVTGVGRLSPMILDNLGIQVALSEATERAAEMYGVEASELTKAQQQAGMMNVVLDKLAKNTAAMPDVLGSATQRFESFKVMMKDTKDEIGLKLLPVIMPLLEVLGNLAKKYLPVVIDKLDKFLKPLAQMAEMFLEAGLSSSEFQEALSMLVGDETAAEIIKIVDQVKDFAMTAKSFIQDVIIPLVVQYWPQIKQALIILGSILAGAMIVSGIMSIVGAIMALFNPVTLIVVAIGLLAAAWMNDWGGIRTFMVDLWDNTLKPILSTLWEWVGPRLTAGLANMKAFWIGVLWPAIQNFWAWIQGTVFPLLQTLWDWLSVNVPIAIQTLSDFWTNVLWPAIETVWEWMQSTLFPFLEVLGELIGVTLGLAVEGLAILWDEVLWPALQKIWQTLQDDVFPWLQEVGQIISEVLGPIISELVDGALVALEKGFNLVSDAIKWATDKIKVLINWLKKINLQNLKDVLPGSLPPLALGLNMVAASIAPVVKGLKDMNKLSLPGAASLTRTLQINAKQAFSPVPVSPGNTPWTEKGIEIHIHGDVGTREDIDILATKLAAYINQRKR